MRCQHLFEVMSHAPRPLSFAVKGLLIGSRGPLPPLRIDCSDHFSALAGGHRQFNMAVALDQTMGVNRTVFLIKKRKKAKLGTWHSSGVVRQEATAQICFILGVARVSDSGNLSAVDFFYGTGHGTQHFG